MSQTPIISKNVMRRVYYLCAIRVATHPATLYSVAFVGLVWWLAELVFVARIWQSFVSQPVGELGSFALEIVQNADSLTLLVTAGAIVVTYGLLRQLQRIPVLSLAA